MKMSEEYLLRFEKWFYENDIANGCPVTAWYFTADESTFKFSDGSVLKLELIK